MRALLRSPGFTLTVLLTLALGIGANTAIFTVVNAVLLRPLPFEQPEQLVAISSKQTRREIGPVSYPDFLDFRARSRSFQDMALYQSERAAFQTPAGEYVSLVGKVASASIFDVLRVRMAHGRGFEPADDVPGKGQVIVLAQSTWKRLFGADPGIVGRDVTLNSQSWKVVGVLPPGFQFPFEGDPAEFWMPLGMQRVTADGAPSWTENRASHGSDVVGRLLPGATASAAQAELVGIAAVLAKEYPQSNSAYSANVHPLAQTVVRDVRTALLVLFGAVGCVLLIACANVANLSLVRATGQRRELAIRAALGAGRARLIRSMLLESVVLALLGGLAGLLLAYGGTSLLLALVPDSIPRASHIGLDWQALGFTLGVSLLTGLGFGLFPAWQASQVSMNDALKDGGRGVSGGGRQARVRQVLVAIQIIVSLVLLVSAGLLLRSFDRLLQQDPGFDPKPLATFRISLPENLYAQPEKVSAFLERALAALRGRPEIAAASAIHAVPLSGAISGTSVDIQGQEKPRGERPSESVRGLSEGYFDSIGMSVRGREFGPLDTYTSPPVALVNESFARRYFPGTDAIGKRIMPGLTRGIGDPVWREIVGVVSDTRSRRLDQATGPEMYVPMAQIPWTNFSFMLRARGDTRSALAAAKAELARLDPTLPIFRTITMSEYVERGAARARFNGLLLAIFSGVALALTGVGIYGVVANSVAQRKGEMGIRLALGATSSQILRLVVRHSLLLTAVSVALGLAAALGATRLLGSLLYDVSAFDPLTFGLVAAGIFAVALAASLLPALRAARTDPASVLRAD